MTKLFQGAFLAGLVLVAAGAPAQPGPLYTPAGSFSVNDHIVSATVFHWFTETQGQQIGPWRPLEGRPAWDGSVGFFKRQIKDIMDANIQVMYVHLMPDHEQRRINLFQAAGELRAEGYNIPKIAPFLDPPLTFIPQFTIPPADLATAAGKDSFVDQYKRFYNQYWSVNTDPYADDYIARFDNKPILNTWHMLDENTPNHKSLTRADVESRLSAAFAASHPAFGNGVYMIGTGLNDTYPMFADERLVQFETHDYIRVVTHNGVRTAQLKAGYWDQNLPSEFREPDAFVPRAGGTNYANAWNTANNSTNKNLNLRRINVESWNEYDEGSGIYEADPGPPYISPDNEDSNTDTWSNSNNPREYIDRTAAGARLFNDIPDYGARILYQDFPSAMYAGTVRNVTVIVRNEGDLEWSAAQDFKFGQQEFLPSETMFGPGRYLMDDTQDEIPKYGGIFRGRPKAFNISIVAPSATGTYNTHWGMLRENVTWFGESLTMPIQVILPKLIGDGDVDGDVDINDLAHLAGSWRTPSGADWLMGDFDEDRDVDRADLNLLGANYPGGVTQARQDFESLVPHWAVNNSGSWLSADNWAATPGGIPGGIDKTATFGNLITSDRLVYANGPVTLGTLTFNSPRTYLLAGTGSLTFQTSTGSALVEVLQGAHKINLPLTLASSTEFNLAPGSTLTLSDPITIAAGKTLTKTGTGTLSFQSTLTLNSGASLMLAGSTQANALALASGSTAALTGDSSAALTVNTLSINDNASLDLGSGSLLVKDADPLGIVDSLRQGFDGGDWLGKGLFSSRAAADSKRGTALGMLQPSEGEALVKYTYYGDADLDGQVDLQDFEQFILGYSDRPQESLHAAWASGDFDYSGSVRADDLELFVRGLASQGYASPQLFARLSAFVQTEHLEVDLSAIAIPEPSTAALVLAATMLMLRSKRGWS